MLLNSMKLIKLKRGEVKASNGKFKTITKQLISLKQAETQNLLIIKKVSIKIAKVKTFSNHLIHNKTK